MAESGLSNNEIDELALAAAGGDDDAMAKLISVIAPVARAKAIRLTAGAARIETDDLTQEGMLGFLQAVQNFDKSKGFGFVAYVNKCIENRIISALRKNTNSKNAALTTAVSIEDNDTLLINDPAADYIDRESTDTIKSIVTDLLSAFEKQVFELRLAGMSYGDIAGNLNCSEKAVDNAVQRIRKKVKDIL